MTGKNWNNVSFNYSCSFSSKQKLHAKIIVSKLSILWNDNLSLFLSLSLSLSFSPISTSKGDKTRQESVAKRANHEVHRKVGLNKSRSYVGRKGSTGWPGGDRTGTWIGQIAAMVLVLVLVVVLVRIVFVVVIAERFAIGGRSICFLSSPMTCRRLPSGLSFTATVWWKGKTRTRGSRTRNRCGRGRSSAPMRMVAWICW